jgi:hypothetical protein
MCCRTAQTEMGHQSFQEASLLRRPAAWQTGAQRLSTENKGGFSYIRFRTGYRNEGYSLSHTWSHIISLAIFLIFIALLFICIYNDWVISPPCPHTLPYHPLLPLSLSPHPLNTWQQLFCPYL